MSRGLGTAQRAILDALRERTGVDGAHWMPVTELAEILGRSPRQVRTAVHALAARDLVRLNTGHTGWAGRGEYGRLRRARPRDDPALPRVLVRAGERWPGSKWSVAGGDVEFIRVGMPTHGLQIILTEVHEAVQEKYAAYLRDRAARTVQL